ncbi:MAG: dihydrofolate reductase [Paludibacteraceae bacterium]|nr:dihydrofolate reductase [Paludibacteraceae bacterium]MBN2787394.1 dihydrofolate reductase [Paludibacteraceae bacterium]
MCKVSIIVALAKNFAIGKDNALLCHIPGDLKRFKELTLNHNIVMGRRTFESLPYGPLPKRKNIVISDIPEDFIEGCYIAESIEEAFELAKNENEVFVIGGGSIYRQTIDKADKLYLTWINTELEGDTFFPEIDLNDWKETFREEHEANGECPYSYSFVNYERK